MGIEIFGWIEIAKHPPDGRGWTGVVALGSLVDQADEVSNALFGFGRVPGTIVPVAARRGLPRDPSPDVQRDVQEIRKFIQEHGDEQFLGFTYIRYEEVMSADLKAFGIKKLSSSDWALVFGLIDRIRATERLSRASIRIVCWAFC